MVAQYLQVKETQPDALLFYRMGDFYEMFFEDAEIAAAATFPAFQSDVLQRLVADGLRYECNLKTRERVREKVKLE